MPSSGALYVLLPVIFVNGRKLMNFSQGLELDEADTNPFANTDGFYPVCRSSGGNELARDILVEEDADFNPAYTHYS